MITKTIDDYSTIKAADLDRGESCYQAMCHMRNLQAAICVARALDRHADELDGLRLDYKRTQRKLVGIIEGETGLVCAGSELDYDDGGFPDYEAFVSNVWIMIGHEVSQDICVMLHGTCDWVGGRGFVYSYSAGVVRDFAKDESPLSVTAEDVRAAFRRVPEVMAEYKRIVDDADSRIQELFSGDFGRLTGYHAPRLTSSVAYADSPHAGRRYA